MQIARQGTPLVESLDGQSVGFQQFAGGHDDLVWRGTLADGLIALFDR